MNEQTIIAIDLETTCLEPTKGSILEIQAYELDSELEIVSSFHGILPFYGTIDDEVVLEMHTRSNLLSEEPTCILKDAFEWFSKFENIILLGSNIVFDRNWLLYHMPALSKHLHYRMVDTNCFYILCPEVKAVLGDKPKNHRANDDILYSIKVARIIKQMSKAILGDK